MKAAAGDPAAEPAATRWSVVLLAVAAGVVVAFQVGKMPSSLPTLRAELGLDLVAAGWAISIFNVIGLVCGIAVGAFADRLGHRRVTLLGLCAVALASLAGAFAGGQAALLFTRFVEGSGAILVMVAAPAMIVRVARRRDLRLALGVWAAYMPAGAAVMVALTPVLLEAIGWRGLWAVNAGVVAIFAAVLAAATRRLPSPPTRHGTRAPWSSLWAGIRLTVTARGPLLLALCFAVYTADFHAVLSFLPTFLIEERATAAAAAAALTALAIAVNVAGNLAAGWLLHRGARRWTLIALATALMGAASLGIYSAAVPDEIRYLLCLLFSVFGGMLPASVLSAAPVHAPTRAHVATTNGLLVQGSNLGQLAGPPALAALVAAGGGWQAAPWLVVGLSAIGILASVALGRLERAAVSRV